MNRVEWGSVTAGRCRPIEDSWAHGDADVFLTPEIISVDQFCN
jgi:hypothetical protein